jgi:hypothetical protein
VDAEMTANEARLKLQEVLAHFKSMTMFEQFELVGPESPGMDGDTPLHVAAMEGRLDLLEVMVPCVPDIDLAGDIGNTPLHYAALFKQVEVAKFLLRHGADISRENEYGDTPSDWMADHPGFVEVLARKQD